MKLMLGPRLPMAWQLAWLNASRIQQCTRTVAPFRPAAEVEHRSSGACGAAPEGPPHLSRYELQTAAAGASAVLPGITQRRALQAAAALGLRVRESPPRGRERAAWREAFLANW
jgi:hypothetical protein